MVWGGETTVTLSASSGASPSGGGRCQELALAAARVLHEGGERRGGITLLAAGTDGRDGATDAAGAIVDAATWAAIAAAGRDPAQALARARIARRAARGERAHPATRNGNEREDVVWLWSSSDGTRLSRTRDEGTRLPLDASFLR